MNYRLALGAVLAATLGLSGCASFTLYMPNREGGPDYVILKTVGNSEKVYDCYSEPGGDTWDPTCVKVKFRSSGISAEKRGVRSDEKIEDYKDAREEKREKKKKKDDAAE